MASQLEDFTAKSLNPVALVPRTARDSFCSGDWRTVRDESEASSRA